MKTLFSVLCLSIATVGCSSPTSPAPVPTTQEASQKAPEPAPPQPPAPEPEPLPAPPAPVPGPPRIVFQAETGWAHWYTELVPNRFEVEFLPNEVVFGPLHLAITDQGRDYILCVERNHLTLSLTRDKGEWSWTINAMEGQAYGGLK